MGNRLRNRKTNIYLSDEEYETMKNKCEEIGINYSEYFRQLIKYGYVSAKYDSDKKELHKKFMYEINHIGNNINQIAHTVNINRFETKKNYEDLLLQVNKLYQSYCKVVQGDVDEIKTELKLINLKIEDCTDISSAEVIEIKKQIKSINQKINKLLKVER